MYIYELIDNIIYREDIYIYIYINKEEEKEENIDYNVYLL